MSELESRPEEPLPPEALALPGDFWEAPLPPVVTDLPAKDEIGDDVPAVDGGADLSLPPFWAEDGGPAAGLPDELPADLSLDTVAAHVAESHAGVEAPLSLWADNGDGNSDPVAPEPVPATLLDARRGPRRWSDRFSGNGARAALVAVVLGMAVLLAVVGSDRRTSDLVESVDPARTTVVTTVPRATTTAVPPATEAPAPAPPQTSGDGGGDAAAGAASGPGGGVAGPSPAGSGGSRSTPAPSPRPAGGGEVYFFEAPPPPPPPAGGGSIRYEPAPQPEPTVPRRTRTTETTVTPTTAPQTTAPPSNGHSANVPCHLLEPGRLGCPEAQAP